MAYTYEPSNYTSPFNYEIKITGLKTKTEVDANSNTSFANSVVQTYWTLTGTDSSNNSGTFSGATPFTSLGQGNTYNFITFSNLVEANVTSWILNEVTGNPGYQQHIDEQIQKQIDEKISPVTEASLPWASANTANTAV